MKRFEAIRAVISAVGDELVVCNLGHPAQELFALRDRPRNFYMLGSMGLASSIGLGLALSRHETVVVIDGDGSLLMNLGTLATIGANRPNNYVLVVVDNESYGSTGFQPTFTARRANLLDVARACGLRHTVTATTPYEVEQALTNALQAGGGPCCILAKTDKGNLEGIKPIALTALELRDRFMESLGESAR